MGRARFAFAWLRGNKRPSPTVNFRLLPQMGVSCSILTHPEVLDLFLQVFDDGILTDAQGGKCVFREAVIIMARNLGSGR